MWALSLFNANSPHSQNIVSVTSAKHPLHRFLCLGSVSPLFSKLIYGWIKPIDDLSEKFTNHTGIYKYAYNKCDHSNENCGYYKCNYYSGDANKSISATKPSFIHIICFSYFKLIIIVSILLKFCLIIFDLPLFN